MKQERKILNAFLLNLFFSVFEMIGGLATGSVAIVSDAVHDMGDAAGISVAYWMEKKSRKKPDKVYTYGYGRYSVLGGGITTLILMAGSVMVLVNGVKKLFYPGEIHAEGMIFFAVVGVVVNLCAAYFTRDGNSTNQRAVNLHMLEDVLGWIVVLVGGVIIRFTGWNAVDSLLSIGVAGVILYHAGKNGKNVLDVLLEKVPKGIAFQEIEEGLQKIEGVLDVHHLHIWSLDEFRYFATLHLVAEGDWEEVKKKVRAELKCHNIHHATLELEKAGEECTQPCCIAEMPNQGKCCHHHHHHH